MTIISFLFLFLSSLTAPVLGVEDIENSMRSMMIKDIRQLTNGLSSDEDELRKLVKQNLLGKYLIATQLYPEALAIELTTLCRLHNVFVTGRGEVDKVMNKIFDRSFEEFSREHEIQISTTICEEIEVSRQTFRKPNFRELDQALKELNVSPK